MNIKDYTNFTENYKNIIIKGAIGSGKSYLAKELASELLFNKSDFMNLTDEEEETFSENVKVIQFHPSLEYSDLIEGLQQQNSNDVRVDGIFKKFCKNAINSDIVQFNVTNKISFDDTEGTENSRILDQTPPQMIDDFGRIKNYDFSTAKNDDEEKKMLNNQIEFYNWHYTHVEALDIIPTLFPRETNYKLLKKEKNYIRPIVDKFFKERINRPFVYGSIEKKNKQFYFGKNYFGYVDYLKTKRYVASKESLIECLANIDNYEKDKKMIASYALARALESYMQKTDFIEKYEQEKLRLNNTKTSENEITVVEKKLPYIFIIEDITEANFHKLFGEACYSLELSHRGKTGTISTKYQTMVSPNDIFYDGFYVPDNVYVIATMEESKFNKISNDYYLRKIFNYINITPEDTEKDILDVFNNDTKLALLEILHKFNNFLENKTKLLESKKSLRIGAGLVRDYYLPYGKNININKISVLGNEFLKNKLPYYFDDCF